MIQRFGAAWHPLTRFNILILLTFVLMQSCMIGTVFVLPGSINPNLAGFLLLFPTMWCGMALIGFLVMMWMAFRLTRMSSRRINYTTRRNLIMVWTAPTALFFLMTIWFPILSFVLTIRSDWNFDRSREALIDRCDTILNEGSETALVGDDLEIGVYSHVNITLRDDGSVWFDIGDDLRSIGYVCLPTDGEPPRDNDEYTFERKDDRFYLFVEEIEDDGESDSNPEATEDREQ